MTSRRWWPLLGVLLLLIGCRGSADSPEAAGDLVDDYLEDYFAMFPSRATAAGRHDRDGELEDLDAARRDAWVARNRGLIAELEERLDGSSWPSTLELEDRLDLELVLRQAQRQVETFATAQRPSRDPLFWTDILANATVFLLVRDDIPAADRLAAATRRAEQLPRLASQARDALAAAPTSSQAAEHFRLAARQARATAAFYRRGFADASAVLDEDGADGQMAGRADELGAAMSAAGARAADALDGLADFLAARGAEASGSPRLGERYAERFRIVTGIDQPLAAVLADAEEALAAKRSEAARYGRRIWSDVMSDTAGPVAAPADDGELLRALFARVAEDRAATVDEFVADYRQLVTAAIDFVRARDVVTLPDPLTLYTGRSPAFFVGQSVGGVYPAGPYAPEADTLFYLPVPPADATAQQRDAFFRDFNHHFNVMITPHELVPGHYLQLKYAARHPRKVRALFADGVYVEGWGTFCERLMLDLGWGGPLDRLAHLKKQLENIARTIVDIRVHTARMSRDEVLLFVREEALQDEQFAANMWTRSITSAPQLTFYYLGYREVWTLYSDIRDDREKRGEAFVLRDFTDGMMELGPVPVRHYRQRMLPSSGAAR